MAASATNKTTFDNILAMDGRGERKKISFHRRHPSFRRFVPITGLTRAFILIRNRIITLPLTHIILTEILCVIYIHLYGWLVDTNISSKRDMIFFLFLFIYFWRKKEERERGKINWLWKSQGIRKRKKWFMNKSF